MKNKKLILIISIALGIFIIIACLFMYTLKWTDQYYGANPYINTTFSKAFSLENFEKIHDLYTKEQVYKLIGEPINHRDRVECGLDNKKHGCFLIKTGENYDNCDIYSKKGKSLLVNYVWISIGVCYDNRNFVIGTNEIGLYN